MTKIVYALANNPATFIFFQWYSYQALKTAISNRWILYGYVFFTVIIVGNLLFYTLILERNTTNDFGLQLKRINKTLRKQYEIDSDQDGLVVTRIDRNGEAFQKGIREGDLVKRVGTEKVESINEFNLLVEKSKSKGTVLLLVKKPGGGSRYFTLNL